MKSLIIVCLLLSFLPVSAQDTSLALSAPLNISTEGWNKVLQTSNGNTLLFHFELKKNLLVKVFDNKHKEVMNKKVEFKLIDVNQLDKAQFEGLYDIGGEAVLFITQQVYNVRSLVRIRFNSTTGDIINEETVVKSENFTRETVAKVLKNNNKEQGYHITCYAHATLDSITNIKLINYNAKNEIENEMPFDINSKGYDFVRLVNSNIDRTGSILICVELSKIIQYPELFERTLMLLYLPVGEHKFVTNKLQLPQKLKIATEEFTVNPFAGTINMFVDKTWDVSYGVKDVNLEYIVQSLFIIPEDISGLREASLRYDTANLFLRNIKSDTSQRYYGDIIHRYTNDAGKTTVLYEDKSSIDQKTILRNPNTQCAANLCLAEYDDNGKEIWSTVLPKAHYYAPTTTYLNTFGKTSESELFTTVCYDGRRSQYYLFNDPDENFDRIMALMFKPIYSYDKTNAVYYHVNKKHEVVRKYLYAKPADGEYRQIYPGSSYFDERNNMLVALTRNIKGKESVLQVLWTKLDD